MSNHPIIKAMRDESEKELTELAKQYAPGWLSSEDVPFKDGYIAATDKWLTIINKAVEMAEFYADKDNWDDNDTFTPTIWNNGSVDLGQKAEEFLASLKERK